MTKDMNIEDLEKKAEEIFKAHIKKLEEMKKEKKFTINSAEKAIGESLEEFEKLCKEATSKIAEEAAKESEKPSCKICGKEMKRVKKTKK